MLFLAALQVNCWFLWAFMTDKWLTGFYVEETACWVGFVIAALIATWSLACARALELAAGGGPEGVRWFNAPGCLNWLFPGLIVFFLAHTLIWAGLTNTVYQRVVDYIHGPVFAELAADAVAAAAGMDAAELVAARGRALAVVQTGFDTYRNLVWHIKGAFLACAGHDLVTWIVSGLLPFPGSGSGRMITPPTLSTSPALPPRLHPLPLPPPRPSLLPLPLPARLLPSRPPPCLPRRVCHHRRPLRRLPRLRRPRARARPHLRRVLCLPRPGV